jgi:hypothetical protein
MSSKFDFRAREDAFGGCRARHGSAAAIRRRTPISLNLYLMAGIRDWAYVVEAVLPRLPRRQNDRGAGGAMSGKIMRVAQPG